jgi:hypothetical protein
MKKNDFTPEAIYDELLNHIVNQDFPNDELDEIGSHVSITDLADIEISSVKKAGSNFIVNGNAMLEVETDMGEGDTASDSYPMTFSYEFDADGKIVAQHSRHIDTSAFFAGSDDYESYLVARSGHQVTFEGGVMDILSLLAQPIESLPDTKCLHRLLYVNVVTILECYLSDFFISRIREDRKLLRKLVETAAAFKEQKLSFSQLFGAVEAIDKKVNSYLAGLVWHRLEEVSKLYSGVLGVVFPSDIKALRDAIAVRHELVHRNSTKHEISELEIKRVAKLAEELVEHIEKRWLDVAVSS